jgi:hypothetical protein
VWEIVFMLLILKIPLVYVCWVVWWAIKAEPEIGSEGESFESPWKPWQHPSGSRPPRRGPHGAPARASARAARREKKTTS